MILTLPGCGGCRKQTPEEQEEQAKQEAEEKAKKEAEKAKKEKEKQKEPYEVRDVGIRPCGLKDNRSHKPGHWLSISTAEAKANHGDFIGEWELEPVRRGNPAPLADTPYTLDSFRPLTLAKGQPKSFESLTWVPASQEPVGLQYGLVNARGGGHAWGGQLGLMATQMPSHQYHFVVLARWPAKYAYLESLPSVQLRAKGADGEADARTRKAAHYHVVRMQSGRRPELPSHALYWTSVACVLWDDMPPGDLEPQQRQALLDWLHWGGQLIISGPETLDTLKGGRDAQEGTNHDAVASSFLLPHLPATPTGTRALRQADFRELSQWSGGSGSRLSVPGELSGVQWQLDPAARDVPNTGRLLVERSIGRGRIVVSAFRLSEPVLVQWQGYDNVLNACLLRRPARQFYKDSSDSEERLEVRWADEKQHPHAQDARLNCNLRYFTRDADVPFHEYSQGTWNQAPDRPSGSERQPRNTEVNHGEKPEESLRGPGVAAWNDFSPVAQAARAALADAAGIKVPNRSFIFWVVAGYLAVLVPLNWSLFRLLGRVEWAWAAAPLIAIGCTVLVIHLAQLNIGFARAQSEITVVELHGGYARAHVTRYTSLYTSLATGYELQLDDPCGQVLPFPKVEKPGEFRMLNWQSYQKLTCRRGDDTRLTGFNVASNFVDYVHSEEMKDLGGAISLQRSADGRPYRIINGTPLTLRNAMVLWRNKESGKVEMARLDAIEPASESAGGPAKSQVLDFREWPSHGPPAGADGQNQAASARANPSGELSLARLTEIAAATSDMRLGDVRLVAAAQSGISALQVEPVAPQSRQVALVVAHLEAGAPEPPQGDANSIQAARQSKADGVPKIEDSSLE